MLINSYCCFLTDTWLHFYQFKLHVFFLCSGLSFDRPKKPRKERTEPDPDEKSKYQEEANQFAMSLVEGLGDPDGKKGAIFTKYSIKIYSIIPHCYFVEDIELVVVAWHYSINDIHALF